MISICQNCGADINVPPPDSHLDVDRYMHYEFNCENCGIEINGIAIRGRSGCFEIVDVNDFDKVFVATDCKD